MTRACRSLMTMSLLRGGVGDRRWLKRCARATTRRRPVSRPSCAAAPKSPPAVFSLGNAMHLTPAARRRATPPTLSSIATAESASSPSCSRANRYDAGSGLGLSTESRSTIRSNVSALMSGSGRQQRGDVLLRGRGDEPEFDVALRLASSTVASDTGSRRQRPRWPAAPGRSATSSRAPPRHLRRPRGTPRSRRFAGRRRLSSSIAT